MERALATAVACGFLWSAQAAAFTFTDDFSGGTLSTLWTTSDAGGNTIVLDSGNQRLVMTQVSQAGSSGVGLQCTVTGDFDGQIDYAILNPPPQSITQERIGFGAGAGIGVVERVSDGYFGGNVYLTDFQTMLGSGSAGIHPWPGIATTDQSGKLRLTRDSTGITGWYWNGGWVQVYNVPTSNPKYYSGPVTISFSIWNSYSTVANGMQIAFDNFYLSAPTSAPCGTPVPAVSTEVPTLTEYGIVLLTLLLGAGGMYYARRQQSLRAR